MDIQPGNTVKITVTSDLKTQRAQKTLARVFLKDPKNARIRNTKAKRVTPSARAGRTWTHLDPGAICRAPRVGDSAMVVATVDVLRDLESVSKYVKVQ